MIKAAYEAGVKYAIEGVAKSKGNVGYEEEQVVETPGVENVDEDLSAAQNQDESTDNRKFRAFNRSAGSYQETTREGYQSSPKHRD